jgi:hypothetical protein
MRHGDPASLIESEVTGAGQVRQTPGDGRLIGAERPGQLGWFWNAPGLGEGVVHGQSQILVVHAHI